MKTWFAVLLLAGSLSRADSQKERYANFYKPLAKAQRVEHALSRLTFGPQPGDSQKVQSLGLERWCKQQLHPETISENPILTERLQALPVLQMNASETYARYPPRRLAAASPRLDDHPENTIAMQLADSKLLRAVYSTHQLQELLVDFWFNHFNVFFGKGADRYFVASYERDAIRPHVFGKFSDLLIATAQSPAMLFYLDNWQSVGLKASGNGRRGLNENYSRELLELHTLGVDGGYTQQDVIEVARCFTGWTIQLPDSGGAFKYNDKVHDKGEKVVLGHRIPSGGGMSDGLTVLNLLARHPATAHHLCQELAQAFVADDPPLGLVTRMANTYMKTDGSLRQVMQTMLKSPEFWSEGAYRAKVKTPFQFVVSAVRATNADVTAPAALADQLQRLGEPLYKRADPAGYPTVNEEWISSAGLLGRMNFAQALVNNRLPGSHVDVLPGTLPFPSTDATLKEVQTALSADGKAEPKQTAAELTGVLLGSPEFQRR